MAGTSGPVSISTKQQRIAELARLMPEKAMTSLSHHMDLDWMKEAHRRTRKDGAIGINGQTGQDYEVNLEDNLRSLLDRAKSGDRYKAPPVRRVIQAVQKPRRLPREPSFETRTESQTYCLS